MKAEEVSVPAAHPSLPEAIAKKWQQEYAEAYAEKHTELSADGTEPSESRLTQHATKEANRVLKVKAPASIAEAEALPSWQVLQKNASAENVRVAVTVDKKQKIATYPRAYVVVTLDGKKHVFEKKSGAPAKAEEKN